MAKGLIGKKIGMSQIFDEQGNIIPVTVLEVGPCAVSQVKSVAKDGYEAIQLAFQDDKEKHLSKAQTGHLAKAGLSAKRVLKEFRDFGDQPAAGAELKAQDVFAVADIVKVTGTSKGKGFQGVIKRYGHHGGPGAHGSRFHRHPGSMGSNTTPGRVFKGRKLPGRTGSDTKTVLNLKVVRIHEAENLVFVSGSVPGPANTIVTIEKI
ncbi:50S ribosomal protein L3 [Leptospira broomii serovar Hurstbridge str. 5399]|uniref:Large ribosomal subunit protein uL3 n=1 Tax=Leptospira broomii serovar Hurstbridge str. 5399 TaxID=1049789 RepID=T0GFG5_9LEPT|nr:50S ribosomal protein L3 [Leptospira broomii]EQA44123.1 50S ribosomal protein L3 [Leptospira broomii serovar Hurstbridge str. 5399]